MTDAADKLARVRKLMAEGNFDAYVVPTDDAHQSEYVAECDQRRAWLSGFTGSAGTAVVTSGDSKKGGGKAALWTDGRYFAQAGRQLDSAHWALQRAREPGTPTIAEWLAEELGRRSGSDDESAAVDGEASRDRRKRVVIDGWLFSARGAEELRNDKAYELVVRDDPAAGALVDKAWGDARPPPPQGVAFVHDVKFAGETHTSKLQRVRDELANRNAFALVVAALDQVAWVFNLRGNDISHNPVFMSYALITRDYTRLYCEPFKLTDEVKEHLGSTVECRPYNAIFADLEELNTADQKVWLEQTSVSVALCQKVSSGNSIAEQSPLTLMKARKNDAEINGLRTAHLHDAVAKATFLHWLQHQLDAGANVSECDAADKLDHLRSEQPEFVSLSFDTISASGPNAAIIHYKPEISTCARVTKDNVYLCDSGGQYRTGTTDVTRTVHFGQPSEDEKRCFTLVLKGHIALDSAVFPEGTDGRTLDVLARLPLWKYGLDYRHGTGHGVGAFLNVHEGPQGIHNRMTTTPVPLEAGMTVTDEPGYYEDGKYGFRIENVLVVREADTPNKFGGKAWFSFEHLTLLPMQLELIDESLLLDDERRWINNYNKECLEKVGPLIKDKDVHDWFAHQCRSL